MNCLNCNTETTNKKFCCRSCSASYNNKLHPKRQKQPKFCSQCNKIILRETRSKLCRNCAPRSLRGNITLHEAIYAHHHQSSAYALVRTRARSIAKKLVVNVVIANI